MMQIKQVVHRGTYRQMKNLVEDSSEWITVENQSENWIADVMTTHTKTTTFEYLKQKIRYYNLVEIKVYNFCTLTTDAQYFTKMYIT